MIGNFACISVTSELYICHSHHSPVHDLLVEGVVLNGDGVVEGDDDELGGEALLPLPQGRGGGGAHAVGHEAVCLLLTGLRGGRGGIRRG